MSRHKDPDGRSSDATGEADLDAMIADAMRARRARYLELRSMPDGGNETATLQARIAAAREST